MTSDEVAVAYLPGLDLRTDQVQALLHSLSVCRTREITNKDRIFDVGCGSRRTFSEFWKLALSKRYSSDAIRRNFVGLDIQGTPQASSKEDFIFIGGKDFNSWEVPKEYRQQFSLVTAIYSWHWIVGDCDDSMSRQRNSEFLQKAASLLTNDGRLAILHLLTDDPMPEITKIAMEALRTSGIDSFKNISLGEYKQRRKSGWNMPANLASIRTAFPSSVSSLHEELLLGSTTWHWLDVDNVWPFWSSVNLPKAFSELSPPQRIALEQSFRRILTAETLAGLGLTVNRRTSFNSDWRRNSEKACEKVFLRVTCHAAQQILHKAAIPQQPVALSSHIAPDLPNRVRKQLAKFIPSFEKRYPWFGEKQFIAYDRRDDEEREIQEVLFPFWECIPRSLTHIYSINLRHLGNDAQPGVGRMLNIGAAENEVPITDDAKNLRALKKDPSKPNITISELVFASHENPDDAIVFTGRWKNHKQWRQLKSSACTIWIWSKDTPGHEFSPPHVVYAEYLTDIHGWSENVSIVNFLWFLLRQLHGYVRSTLLVTSNKALGENDKSLDSASITFLHPSDSNVEFPTTSDCFLVIDALQTLAVLRERLRAGQHGQQREFQRWRNVMGHELTKVYSPLADILKSQTFKALPPQSQDLVIAFCQHTFVVGDLWTVTGKDDEIIRADKLATCDGISSALERCCELAWKFQQIKKNAIGLLVLSKNPQAVSDIEANFSPQLPPYLINVDWTNAGTWVSRMTQPWQGDSEFANWFRLIVVAVVGNAFKHSDSREKITLKVSFDMQDGVSTLNLKISNIHNNPELLDAFKKKYPSGLHAPTTGTFMVLDHCGRELYQSIGISEKYHVSQFCSVNLTPSTADVTLLFPCGVSAMKGEK